jgi:hypothetical protein
MSKKISSSTASSTSTSKEVKGDYFLQLEKIRKKEEEAQQRTVEKLKHQTKSYNSNITEIRDPINPLQQYALVAFINPRTILPKREIYLFHKFVEKWSMKKSMDKFEGFLQFISYNYKLDYNEVLEEYQDFIKNELSTFTNDDISADFNDFLENYGEQYNKEFDAQNEFRTSVSAFKISGCYATEEEKDKEAKKLLEIDNRFDLETIPVGQFIAYDPYKKGKIEYADEQINELFKKKTENELKAKQMFDKRVLEAKQKAIEENIKNAEKNNTKLTQGIDEYGNLTGGLKSLNLDERTPAPSELEKGLKGTK